MNTAADRPIREDLSRIYFSMILPFLPMVCRLSSCNEAYDPVGYDLGHRLFCMWTHEELGEHG